MSIDHELDVLNSASIDDLQDLPEFKAWPTGSYLVAIETSIDEDEYEDDDGVTQERLVPVIRYTLTEVLELENKKDTAPEPGASFIKRCYLRKRNGERNAGGEGEFKMVVAAVAHMFPDAENNAERFTLASGCTLAMTTKLVKRKDKETKEIREENRVLSLMDPANAS